MPLDQDIFQMLFSEAASEHDRSRAAQEILREAEAHYDARSDFRGRRARARDYFAGRQWEALMDDPTDPAGGKITEKEAILRQNRLPLVMNMVANVLNNLDGLMRQNKSERHAFATDSDDDEAVAMLNLARREVRRYNSAPILEADNFREHAMSGASAAKSTYARDARRGRVEVIRHNVDQTRLFFNADVLDRRFEGQSGLRIIGQTHDASIYEVVRRFARTRGEGEQLRATYAKSTRDLWRSRPLSGERPGFAGADSHDFLLPVDASLCRVIEVWLPVYLWQRTAYDPLREAIEAGFGVLRMSDEDALGENERRGAEGLPPLELDEARYEPVWHYLFLSPWGDILQAAPTPYWHGEHPYSLGMTMLIDGETWGIIDNIIDAQRWLNRLLSNVDHMMGAGAKGAPAYDKSFFSEGGYTQSMVDAWYTSFNTSLGLDVPQGKSLQDFVHIFQANTLPAGYFELIPLMVDFLGRIPGVTESLQGLKPDAGTPASLYRQQILQSATNVAVYTQTYLDALRLLDRKEIQLIAQTTSARQIRDEVSGRLVAFDPERVAMLDADVALGDVTDTATLRLFYEQDAQLWLQNGFFGPPSPESLLLFLEVASAHPRGEEMRQKLAEALGQGQAAPDAGGFGGAANGAAAPGLAIGGDDAAGALAAAALLGQN